MPQTDSPRQGVVLLTDNCDEIEPLDCPPMTESAADARNRVSITVIIPVHNSAQTLDTCLRELARSDLPALECVVVDDSSTDASAGVAVRHGATVIRVPSRRGPAHARNLGALAARGDTLLFLDADVSIHSETLSQIASRFESEPNLDALFGSYDDSPAASAFLSQYRNLLHCFIHQRSRPQASTFWAGCGAIRRRTFLEYGGFDESYRNSCIEDIEFGYRLTRAGKSILLDRTILVKHLKTWTLFKMVKADICARGIPWTRLILTSRFMPNDLNVRWDACLSALLTILLLAAAFSTAFLVRSGSENLILASSAAAGALFGIVALNGDFLWFLRRKRGRRFAVAATIPLLGYYLCCLASVAVGLTEHVVSKSRRSQ